jgi:hypothetical protein
MKIIVPNYFLILIIFLFTSCTFLKSTNDHNNFVEEKLKSLYNQKSIYQPNSLSDFKYDKYENYKFIDYLVTKRTKNGTFLTTGELYETYYNFSQCLYTSRQWNGYFWDYSNMYGTKLESILKKPIGTVKIRTDFDGDEIYLINLDIKIIDNKEEDKKYWQKLFAINGDCK